MVRPSTLGRAFAGRPSCGDLRLEVKRQRVDDGEFLKVQLGLSSAVKLSLWFTALAVAPNWHLTSGARAALSQPVKLQITARYSGRTTSNSKVSGIIFRLCPGGGGVGSNCAVTV